MIKWSSARHVWALAVCGMLAASCGGTQEQPSGTAPNEAPPALTASPATDGAGQSVSIMFVSEPDPPKAGDNALQVRVTRPDGSPVTDATVTAVFSMPAMPSMNMPAMRSTASLAHQAEGLYRGVGQLSMAGTWSVRIAVSRGPDELGSKSFSVIARK